LNNGYKHVANLSKCFDRKLKNLSKEYRERVLNKVSELALDIAKGKTLRGRYRGKKSLRVGIYRIIYEEPKHCVINLLDIRHRETAYRT